MPPLQKKQTQSRVPPCFSEDAFQLGKPLRQEAKRFHAVNGEALTIHFAMVEKMIEEYNIDALRTLNLDEVVVAPSKDANGKLGCRQLMPHKGVQDFDSCDFSYDNSLTMMPVINSAGDCGPPLFVMMGKRVPYRNVLKSGTIISETPMSQLPLGAVLGTRAQSGGVDREIFLSCAEEFMLYTKDIRIHETKVLLIYDGYRSHISLEVLDLFLDSGIIIYALPAYTLGKTRPLDVVLFSVFTDALNKAVTDSSVFTDRRNLDIFGLCSVMQQAYQLSFTRYNVMAGFRRAGLWPLNSTRLFDLPLPASAALDASLRTVGNLKKAHEACRLDLREVTMGSDAKMLNCRYLDMQSGFVMTSATALGRMRKKESEKKKKKEHEKKKALEKEIKLAQRRSKALLEFEGMRSAQRIRRAKMADMTVEEFTGSVRWMDERRAAAKIRVFERRGNC